MRGNMSGIIMSLTCAVLLALLVRVDASVLNDCRRETQVSWESLRQLGAGNFETNDPRVKCYVKCYMTKLGVLNEDGRLDFTLIRRLTPNYKELIEKFGDCAFLGGTDLCDKAFQIAKCIASRHKNLEDIPLA